MSEARLVIAETLAKGRGRDAQFQSMRILFNTPRPTLQGGLPAHRPTLERALSALVEVHQYEYGRKSDTEALGQKIFGRVGDLLRVRSLCRKVRPDLLHHNSAIYFAHRMDRAARMIGVDVNADCIRQNEIIHEGIVGDLHSIPLADSSVDVIVSVDTIDVSLSHSVYSSPIMGQDARGTAASTLLELHDIYP